MKIKENAFIAKLAAKKLKSDSMAITIGETVYLYNTTKEAFLSDRKWLRHEMQHVKQFQQYGLVRFVVLYVWESIRKGYYNNKWEVEARAAEENEW